MTAERRNVRHRIVRGRRRKEDGSTVQRKRSVVDAAMFFEVSVLHNDDVC